MRFSWDVEAIDLVSKEHFHVYEPGPLHAPVIEFTISRSDDLAIMLETKAAFDAVKSEMRPPSGTIRINDQEAKLSNFSNKQAIFSGIQTFNVTSTDDVDGGWINETSRIHKVKVTLGNEENSCFLIEWVENFQLAQFIWPDSIQTESETTTVSKIAFSDEGLVISSSFGTRSFSNNAAKINVAGHIIYLCALSKVQTSKAGRGCIIYSEKTDDLTRKKIRNAISFSLGFYLVEIGHTIYNKEWHVIEATSISAYSLSKRTFDGGAMPLASLSRRNFQYDLDRDLLARAVNALFINYEKFDLGNIGWAYWHAGTATPHIAPAHYGAAIEALQTLFCKEFPQKGNTKILPTKEWKRTRESIFCTIDSQEIDDESKLALKGKLHHINKQPQRVVLKSVFDSMNMKLSGLEDDAWKRRNNAAHGLPIAEGNELEAIRDVKVLRVLFNRMLLKITGSAENYIDYATPGFPIKHLDEPI